MPTCQTSSLNEGRIGRSRQPEFRAILVVGHDNDKNRANRNSGGPWPTEASPADVLTEPRQSPDNRRWATGELSVQSTFTQSSAQRRPVLSDRQLNTLDGLMIHAQVRSTKAGPVGPATLQDLLSSLDPVPARSTKAGPVGPATRVPAADLFGALLSRSTKAGPVGPATPVGRCGSPNRLVSAQRRPVLSDRQLFRDDRERQYHGPALNEGRSCRTGNSHRRRPAHLGDQRRSTKAGPVGPATPGTRPGSPRRRRGAQRRPVLSDRQLFLSIHPRARGLTRSTKAGPVGPATPVVMIGAAVACACAQRRPVLSDRQLRATGRRGRGCVRRSTKAGPVGPATPGTWEIRVTGADGTRSTKAGPVGPATPSSAFSRQSSTLSAQRRPVLSDRQLFQPARCSLAWGRHAQRRPVLSDRQLRGIPIR